MRITNFMRSSKYPSNASDLVHQGYICEKGERWWSRGFWEISADEWVRIVQVLYATLHCGHGQVWC